LYGGTILINIIVLVFIKKDLEMTPLKVLWRNCGENPQQKFRFVDWNHRTKFFQIKGITQDQRNFHGKLDNGEELFIPIESDFWVEYYPGDENRARAV
jgi:hypothetical protein